MEWFKKVVFENYANFSGRARRKEYWMFMLFFMIFTFVVAFVSAFVGIIGTSLLVIWYLALTIPSLAVTVRRFHDCGKTGWWYLASFAVLVPVVLFMILINMGHEGDVLYVILGILTLVAFLVSLVPLILLFRDSQPGTNQWGPNPKEDGDYREMPPAL